MKKYRYVVFIVASIGIFLYSYINRNTDVTSIDTMLVNVNRINFTQDIFISEYIHNNTKDRHIVDNSVESADSLYSRSDLVLKVRPISRTQYGGYVKTKASVQEIYQGTNNLKEIYILEKYQIYSNQHMSSDTTILSSNNGTMPMKNETDYLVFLHADEGYVKQNVFLFTSDYFGKYPILKQLSVATIPFELEQGNDVNFDSKFESLDLYHYQYNENTLSLMSVVIDLQREELDELDYIEKDYYIAKSKQIDFYERSLKELEDFNEKYIGFLQELFEREGIVIPSIKEVKIE